MEIERRFLVRHAGWRGLGPGTPFRQGFLSTAKERVVRVRIADNQATLTIKGLTQGFSKHEFNYPIPMDHAQLMLDQLCERPLIEKTRYRIEANGLTWEVDEFAGDNQGLILAEVELEREDQEVPLPDWVGEEVSHDPRYFNSSLVQHPYNRWKGE